MKDTPRALFVYLLSLYTHPETLTPDHGIPNSAGLELAIAEGTAYESLHIII